MSALRSESGSIGLLVVRSTTPVPWTCPRRMAKSLMPSTDMAPIGRSGIARTVRSKVSRPTVIPSRSARREPARPAIARPIASITVSSIVVRRAYRFVSAGTCSANVVALQSVLMQKNRRTVSSSMTGWAPIVVSAGLRRYREWTRSDAVWHFGHRASLL